ncbi:DUF2087 domain-containing protein [Roseateles sp. DAIF2]|uniref:DUF2087 domain-containing protein n=1 Tax=Roseateles sp. DAIF2 TaxID=2714952 RepID=UPI0018A32746|nr:DUF2087 domain-containing protein [Roseateles sp. DAIF2]QPF73582.1 DUF2087 domain-containing protein [Roseateles sp. DAIF2]
MPRETIACPVPDLSAFAKTLRRQLAEATPAEHLPSHLSLMNMLARAAGHRNLQALKATPPAADPSPPSDNPGRLPERQRLAPQRGPRHPALGDTADRALRQFDTRGRLMRWPTKYSVQRQALWGLWLHFDAKRPYTEREVNQILQAWHGFGDHCTLRRELINMKLLARTPDGAVYRKCPARPDGEVSALLRALRERHQAPPEP